MKRNKNMSDEKYMDLLEYYVRSRKVLMIFAVPFFIILAIVICAVFPQCWWLCFVSLFFGGCSVAAYLVAKHYLKKKKSDKQSLKKEKAPRAKRRRRQTTCRKGMKQTGHAAPKNKRHQTARKNNAPASEGRGSGCFFVFLQAGYPSAQKGKTVSRSPLPPR